jgi:hypothetical protein
MCPAWLQKMQSSAAFLATSIPKASKELSTRKNITTSNRLSTKGIEPLSKSHIQVSNLNYDDHYPICAPYCKVVYSTHSIPIHVCVNIRYNAVQINCRTRKNLKYSKQMHEEGVEPSVRSQTGIHTSNLTIALSTHTLLF